MDNWEHVWKLLIAAPVPVLIVTSTLIASAFYFGRYILANAEKDLQMRVHLRDEQIGELQKKLNSEAFVSDIKSEYQHDALGFEVEMASRGVIYLSEGSAEPFARAVTASLPSNSEIETSENKFSLSIFREGSNANGKYWLFGQPAFSCCCIVEAVFQSHEAKKNMILPAKILRKTLTVVEGAKDVLIETDDHSINVFRRGEFGTEINLRIFVIGSLF